MANQKSKTRYQLLEQVGAGDFAKVFAAEDTKLGRKVAIKQLHSQFVDDQEKLERYWQEAQMLVDLEHPNIMTIYDIVKSRGYLVLELMQGSLKQIYGAKPMPVQDVRETIRESAKGLSCLHKSGIIHGDVKPGNLMLSRQNIVKLGDFGLARRASDDDGSLLKGTTKYMAPELVSEEFGDVGPASDLYSLGFSALELMVGPEFDSLFPDLVAFGRDRQMAWMMWHCSADRKFPPIQTVLAGVPDDLAAVVDKLTTKDQSRRYTSADDLISDLSGGAKPVGVSLEEEARAAAVQAQKARKRRFRVGAACLFSLLLTLAIIFFPRAKPEPVVFNDPPPLRGVIQNVLTREQKFVLDYGNDFEEFEIKPRDEIKLNRKSRQLRDLQLGDRAVVQKVFNDQGNWHFEIEAFRPETHQGVISEILPDENKFELLVKNGVEQGTRFMLSVTDECSISLNQQRKRDGKSLALSDLKADDRVVIHLSDDATGMLALKVDATRVIHLEGIVRKLDPRRGTITLAGDLETEDNLVELPVDPDCVFLLNGLDSLDDRLLNVTDIQIGDRVSIDHDLKILSVDAYRPFRDEGRILEIDFEDNQFVLKSESAVEPRRYRVDDNTKILLADEAVQLTDLRTGDPVELVHESPDDDSPTLLSLNATRPVERKKWAILVANQDFKSTAIPAVATAVADVAAIKHRLIGRFGVPENQITVYENEDRVRLERELPLLFNRVGNGDELYVYVATRGFIELEKYAYLAPSDFSPTAMESTGIPLDWLIDQLDASPAKKKLLMLDCNSDKSDQLANSASGATLIRMIKSSKRGGYPRTTYVLTSCSESNQSTLDAPDAGISLFAKCLADAFAGNADQERDNQVAITELTKYVIAHVTSIAESQNVSQNPRLFLPDNRPPRLSDSVQKRIIELLALFGQKGLDSEQVILDSMAVSRLANGEPEPMLACGLILIKMGRLDDALEILETMRMSNQELLLAHQAVVWIHFRKKRYDVGMIKLRAMLAQIPKPEKEDETYSEDTLKKIEWAGKLRELAGSESWTIRPAAQADLDACDQIVASHEVVAQERYAAGRLATGRRVEEFAEALKEDADSAADLIRERIQSYVAPIASAATIAEIRRGLDR